MGVMMSECPSGSLVEVIKMHWGQNPQLGRLDWQSGRRKHLVGKEVEIEEQRRGVRRDTCAQNRRQRMKNGLQRTCPGLIFLASHEWEFPAQRFESYMHCARTQPMTFRKRNFCEMKYLYVPDNVLITSAFISYPNPTSMHIPCFHIRSEETHSALGYVFSKKQSRGLILPLNLCSF